AHPAGPRGEIRSTRPRCAPWLRRGHVDGRWRARPEGRSGRAFPGRALLATPPHTGNTTRPTHTRSATPRPAGTRRVILSAASRGGARRLRARAWRRALGSCLGG